VRLAWLTVAAASLLAAVATVLGLLAFSQPTLWLVAVPVGAASYVLWSRGTEQMTASLYREVDEAAVEDHEHTEDWHRDWPPDDDVEDLRDVEEPWDDWEWADRAPGPEADPDEDSWRETPPGSEGTAGARDGDWYPDDRTGRDRDGDWYPGGGASRERDEDWYPDGRGRQERGGQDRDGDWYPHGGRRRERDSEANREREGDWYPHGGRRQERGSGGAGIGSDQATVSPEVERACRVLGVEPDASPEEVKRAYREAVKEAHPDLGGSREAFKRVRWAYERLTREE
jgi:hypothetical protein